MLDGFVNSNLSADPARVITTVYMYNSFSGPTQQKSIVWSIARLAGKCFPKNIRHYVATFKFFVFAICKKLIKIVKPVEQHAGNKSRDKLYQVAFIV